MCRASDRPLAVVVLVALYLALLPTPARAGSSTCAGIERRSEHVRICITSDRARRHVTVRTGAETPLSAEAGLDVLSCSPRGTGCRSLLLHTGPGDYFPDSFDFSFEGRSGLYRIEYGVCDKVQEVCLPGQIEFRLTDRP